MSDEAAGSTTAPLGNDWHDDPVVGLGAKMGRYELVSMLGAGGMGVVFAAHDPELDRTVAVKILRSTSGVGAAGEARLRREGQTMARLTHPNVMRVYDVGVAHGRAWVAMELVSGGTLASWLDRESRSPAEIMAAFCEAGRGLAAAHDAGLVHRDFKSANVLVGDDGRVLVTDFGLARTIDDASDTRSDNIAGTPAYMAPEQLRGDAVDARADQFSFCVALWRALFGAAPYTGDSATDLRDAIERGALASPPPAAIARVPKPVRVVLERGLSRDPDARFASMRELLAQIPSAPRARRAWLWLAAVGVAAIAIAGVLVFALATPADPCPAPERAIAAAWSAPRRDALHRKIASLDPMQSEPRFAATLRTVEPFVAAWRSMHVEACRATRVEGAQSDTLFDLRVRCLDRRLSELDASVVLVETSADRVQLDNAIEGLTQLTPLAGCADAANVAREGALPVGPRRADAERLADRIQHLRVEARASRLVGLPAAAAAVVAEARKIDHPPTLAGALETLAQIQNDVDDTVSNEATLRELTDVAAAAHDDASEAYAWRSLVIVLGYLGKPDQALQLVPAARAAVLRAGDTVELRAELLYAEASVLDGTPRVAEAIAKLDEARKLLEDGGATRPGSPLAARLEAILFERGIALAAAGDHAGAIATYRDAIERQRAIYGPDSVDEAMALHNLGEAARHGARYDEALAALNEAKRINLARAGESPRAASNLVSIATIYLERHDWQHALSTYDDAIAMYRRVRVAGGAQKLVPALVGRASVLGHLDRVPEALATYQELIAIIESSGTKTVNLAIAHYNRGELERRQGMCESALPDYRQATELYVANRGPTTSYLLDSLVGEGKCLVELRRPADAIPLFERVLGLTPGGNQAERVASANAWLGRALVESGRDRARGLALARRGRELLAAAAGTDRDDIAALAALDRWLAAQR